MPTFPTLSNPARRGGAPRRRSRRPQTELNCHTHARIVVRQDLGRPRGRARPLYIDLHLVHEVTSPQAFDGLRLAERKVRRPDRTLATADHNIPTRTGRPAADPDELSAFRCRRSSESVPSSGSPSTRSAPGVRDRPHRPGPELGVSQPGMTIVCGDSHTATHGAFGALAFGIGTSEVEHVLATQCLVVKAANGMRIRYTGRARRRASRPRPHPRDDRPGIGVAGANGHVVEHSPARR